MAFGFEEAGSAIVLFRRRLATRPPERAYREVDEHRTERQRDSDMRHRRGRLPGANPVPLPPGSPNSHECKDGEEEAGNLEPQNPSDPSSGLTDTLCRSDSAANRAMAATQIPEHPAYCMRTLNGSNVGHAFDSNNAKHPLQIREKQNTWDTIGPLEARNN